MSEEENNYSDAGSATSPKHFIYLDRGRLLSYTSQMMDGLTQLRHLFELTSERVVDTPGEKEVEYESNKTGEGGGGFGVPGVGNLDAKAGTSEKLRRSYKSSDPTKIRDTINAFTEDKAEYDNLYILLEKNLRDSGQIIEVESGCIPNGRLAKITGAARFFDWQSMLGLLKNPDEFLQMNQQSVLTKPQQVEQKRMLKIGMLAIENFSLGKLTLTLKNGSQTCVSSLNPLYLCMTTDQLRSGYIMAGDVEVSVMGFIPKQSQGTSDFGGVIGSLDMRQVWSGFIGQYDYVIDPIAVYAETNNY
jgi:hypothetical protein